jgi:cyclase
VFGHGNEKFGVTGRKADLAKMADYLTAVLNHVHTGVKAGRTRDEITKVENLPGYEEYTWPGRRMTLSTVLNVAWEEVTDKE